MAFVTLVQIVLKLLYLFGIPKGISLYLILLLLTCSFYVFFIDSIDLLLR